MPNIRTIIGGVGGKYISRVPGTMTAIQVSSFRAEKLKTISGDELAPIIFNAMILARDQAIMDWPKDTHASVETIELEIKEVGPKFARVALQAGGPKLISDPRNKKKIDYAPFIEFNGTPTTHPGTMTVSVLSNEENMKQAIRAGLIALIEAKLKG